MVKELRFAGAVFAFICVFATLSVSIEALAANKPSTLSGVVRRVEVDRRGEVRQVYIAVKDIDERILVSRQAKGRKFLKLSGATVRGTGYVRKASVNDPDFTKVIAVTEYTVETAKTTP